MPMQKGWSLFPVFGEVITGISDPFRYCDRALRSRVDAVLCAEFLFPESCALARDEGYHLLPAAVLSSRCGTASSRQVCCHSRQGYVIAFNRHECRFADA